MVNIIVNNMVNICTNIITNIIMDGVHSWMSFFIHMDEINFYSSII
jgi:hypothetical protein